MNPSNVLSLISDLYGQIQVLAHENAELRAAAQSTPDSPDSGPSSTTNDA